MKSLIICCMVAVSFEANAQPPKTKKPVKELTCKLTSAELRERKKTVIKSLKSQIIEKKELPTGYQYKFAGTDKMIDELAEFVKTERACCDFFNFTLSFEGENAFLEITGPKGAKDFIKSELQL
ncbi:MAG: hypothetical protein QM737_22145 [Ferruginibacter sp.]